HYTTSTTSASSWGAHTSGRTPHTSGPRPSTSCAPACATSAAPPPAATSSAPPLQHTSAQHWPGYSGLPGCGWWTPACRSAYAVPTPGHVALLGLSAGGTRGTPPARWTSPARGSTPHQHSRYPPRVCGDPGEAQTGGQSRP